MTNRRPERRPAGSFGAGESACQNELQRLGRASRLDWSASPRDIAVRHRSGEEATDGQPQH